MNLNRPGRRLAILLLITTAIFTLTYWSFGGIPEQWSRGEQYLSRHRMHVYNDGNSPSLDPKLGDVGAEDEDDDNDHGDGSNAEPKFPEDEDETDWEGYNAHTPSLPKNKLGIDHKVLTGTTIASKLGNETAKAELGRAAWKLFHTTFARFPDKPSADEQEALRAWVLLFARLYPCGECAQHFQEILGKFPPQVTSRSNAAAWGCHVHNKVNESLDKELFNCSKIGDFYDCGCADGDESDESNKDASSRNPALEDDSDVAEDEREPVELEKEGLQRGG